MMAGLAFRQDYFSDPTCYAGLTGLLRETFDIDISLQDRFGGPNPTAMPFGYFEANGRCVANFSAFAMPLVIQGRQINAVGYQSGAVRPEYRGLGLYRALMQRAFAWSQRQGFEMGLLLTDKPRLYQPYGFRCVPQHAFRSRVQPRSATGQGARALSLDNPADIDRLQRLLKDAVAVSTFFSVARRDYFLLNACFDADIHVSFLPGEDIAVAWKAAGNRLSLLDVVGRYLPPIADIVSALGNPPAGMPAEIETCFPPDQLHWPDARPVRHVGVCELMVATAGALPSGPFMLSPMADF